MKYIILSVVLLAALALAQTNTTPAPASQSTPVDQESAGKAKALLDQAIQALGGDAYMNIRDITQEGRTYAFHHGESE